jgi:hypothetical protein
MSTDRRFPPPWTVEDIGAAFVVKDSGGVFLLRGRARAAINSQTAYERRGASDRGRCGESCPFTQKQDLHRKVHRATAVLSRNKAAIYLLNYRTQSRAR